MRFVLDTDEIKTTGRKSRRRQATICHQQQFANPSWWVLALADIDQTADQIAHHVMQKSTGFEVENHQIANPPDISLAQCLYG